MEIEVDAEVEYRVSSPEPPASPHSALTIVQAFGKEGLADDVAQRLAGTAVDKMLKRAADQEDTITKLRNEVLHLRARHAPTPVIQLTIACPQGFIRNTGTLSFSVPHRGGRARARFIRVSPDDPSYAEGTMGEPDSEVYLTPLYAAPRDDDDLLVEPLPDWFRTLVHSGNPHYRSLIQGSHLLEDWGLTADIARYRATHERIHDLQRAQEGIEDSLARLRESLDLIACRLGAAHAADRLACFQNLADLVRDPAPGAGGLGPRRGAGQTTRPWGQGRG